MTPSSQGKRRRPQSMQSCSERRNVFWLQCGYLDFHHNRSVRGLDAAILQRVLSAPCQIWHDTCLFAASQAGRRRPHSMQSSRTCSWMAGPSQRMPQLCGRYWRVIREASSTRKSSREGRRAAKGELFLSRRTRQLPANSGRIQIVSSHSGTQALNLEPAARQL